MNPPPAPCFRACRILYFGEPLVILNLAKVHPLSLDLSPQTPALKRDAPKAWRMVRVPSAEGAGGCGAGTRGHTLATWLAHIWGKQKNTYFSDSVPQLAYPQICRAFGEPGWLGTFGTRPSERVFKSGQLHSAIQPMICPELFTSCPLFIEPLRRLQPLDKQGAKS